MTAIASSFQPKATVAPRQSIQFVDPQSGNLSTPAIQFLQQLYQFVTGTNRVIPANCTGVNSLTLTLLSIQPAYDGYASYDTFGIVATATTTGPITAQVVTSAASLASLPVLKANGASAAGSGDMTIGLQYFLTFVDTLNSGNGAFVLR